MKSSTDYRISDSLALLLVGDPKSGKTCIAAAFPDPYFLDVDGNLDSAVRVLGTKRFWFDQPAIGCEKKEDVWKAALTCLSEAMKNPEIKTIVLDSLSVLAEYMMHWIISEHTRMGDRDKSGKPIDAMTIPDYGKLLQMFRGLIFDLRKSGKHLVVTVHRATYQDEVTKVINPVLALPGQAKETLGGSFKDVWATLIDNTPGKPIKYILRTSSKAQFPPLGTSIRRVADARLGLCVVGIQICLLCF